MPGRKPILLRGYLDGAVPFGFGHFQGTGIEVDLGRLGLTNASLVSGTVGSRPVPPAQSFFKMEVPLHILGSSATAGDAGRTNMVAGLMAGRGLSLFGSRQDPLANGMQVSGSSDDAEIGRWRSLSEKGSLSAEQLARISHS